VEAYKNENAICTFLPIFHIFLVHSLCTGGIHIEDSSGRGTESGLLRSDTSGISIGLERHDGNVGIAEGEYTSLCECGFIQCAKSSASVFIPVMGIQYSGYMKGYGEGREAWHVTCDIYGIARLK
jgi:hypothetical protein